MTEYEELLLRHYEEVINNMMDAVARLRKIHHNDGNGFCAECLVGRVVDPDRESPWVYEEYPCPTIKALDGEQ